MIRLRAHQRYLYKRRKAAGRGMPSMGLLALFAPLVMLVATSCVGLAALGMAYFADAQLHFTPPEQAIAARGGGARIYDRHGTLLYEFLDNGYGYQTPVKLDHVSPLIQQATIAAEDADFYDNPGINIRGLVRAGFENLRPGDSFMAGSGGSSITQQLVKQIYFTPKEREERTISRKMKEAALAIELTNRYPKDQILEWYLNEIPYGGLFMGVEAASEGYFGIPATDVNLAQAAFLAGLPQSPSEFDPFQHFDAATVRQHEVLDLMARHGVITQDVANFAKLARIELHPKPQPFLAPHFVEYVADYIRRTLGENALMHGGLNVMTTLDLPLNQKANELLEQHIETYEKSANAHNGSVVVIQPATGQILAMVGSRDYFRDDVDGRVNNAIALNSPGSTLKPFTYATAFMQGWGPDWPIVDTPIKYRQADGTDFVPRNPDGKSHGVIPLRIALGNSFNIPAFKTILWVGVPNMVATAKAMGITTLDRDLGPAVTLGGSDVKLLDMVYGYSTFANDGIMAGMPTTQSLPPGNRKLDPIPVLAVTNRAGEVLLNNTQPHYEVAMEAQYAYMVTDILSNDENRQITYGRGSSLNIPGWRVAAKTGTSEPYVNSHAIGDTWTFGYTPDIAVGVWVGNSDNSPMVNIFSTTIAGSTWHDVMVAALAGKQPRDFVKPDGIIKATVCVPSGIAVKPGISCPSVTSTFAAEALARQNDTWWGGQDAGVRISNVSLVPAAITGWKRYLADEYLRSYGPRTPPRETAASTGPPDAVAPGPPSNAHGQGGPRRRRGR
ncbi:MAG: hypothetical protein EPO22_06620 [Dehalococcoidia bacterium]|nr:MAG: hypothetical protein EPO22_06620 [Dehalococcoidia bacterium]